MPRGLKTGNSIYECLCGYQWLLYAAALCVVHKENPNRRLYETVVLEVARKSFKTFTLAAIFVLVRSPSWHVALMIFTEFLKIYAVA